MASSPPLLVLREHLRSHLRKLVIVTSGTPLATLFRDWYRLAVWAVANRLRRNPAVKALYLRRSVAKGEFTPGVSDVDFAAIVETESDPAATYLREYQRLRLFFPMLDPKLRVHDASTLQEEHDREHFYQFRLAEGAVTNRLLFGEDYLARLRLHSGAAFGPAAYAELSVWWTEISYRVFTAPEWVADPVLRNNIARKSVLALLQCELALLHNHVEFRREAAVAAARGRLPEEAVTFSEAVLRRPQALLSIPDEELARSTLRYGLRRCRAVMAALADHPMVAARGPLTVEVDAEGQLPARDPALQMALAPLLAWLREDWPGFRSASLLPSLWHPLDTSLLLLEVDPDAVEDAERFAALCTRWRALVGRLPRPVELYLLLPEAAFLIPWEMETRILRRVLHPLIHPDLFLLLRDPTLRLAGTGASVPVGDRRTPLTEHFVWENREQLLRLLMNPQQARRLSVVRVAEVTDAQLPGLYWEALRLWVAERALREDRLEVAYTLEALLRALERAGSPLPTQVKPLLAHWPGAAMAEPASPMLLADAREYLEQIGALTSSPCPPPPE